MDLHLGLWKLLILVSLTTLLLVFGHSGDSGALLLAGELLLEVLY